MSSNPIRNRLKDRQEAFAGTVFEYLIWRGDLLFSQVPPCAVDALIFSTLAYVIFDGIVPEDSSQSVSLREVVEKLTQQEDFENRCFWKDDGELLQVAAQTQRYSEVRLCNYRTVFLPEEETQFAAVTFLLSDGTAFLAFRGTDHSIVGWKEDFNMAFQDSVPAQRLAQEYVQQFASGTGMDLRVCGHSKGGNLAVYAAAKSPRQIQDRILAVYNHDGPGFTEAMMQDSGYLNIVPKIHTYVPQSSIVGMLLDHKEKYTIVRSKRVGVMQHNPYSWTVLGNDFILMEELTSESRFLDKTLQAWLADMPKEERNEFIDAVFDTMLKRENGKIQDLLKPKMVKNYYTDLRMDEEKRKMIASAIQKLLEIARKVDVDTLSDS